jgi:hypothetical protein
MNLMCYVKDMIHTFKHIKNVLETSDSLKINKKNTDIIHL